MAKATWDASIARAVEAMRYGLLAPLLVAIASFEQFPRTLARRSPDKSRLGQCPLT